MPHRRDTAAAPDMGRTHVIRPTGNIAIGTIAFLTVVDLFAAQAILPSLAAAFGETPGRVGAAVNATTFGMALAGLAVAALGGRVDRRRGIVASLAFLAVPTSLLAFAPDLPTFAALRVLQGLAMATAFALTLAWLGEQCSASASAGAFAAYVTGNVASNLFGRLVAAWIADHIGLAASFYALAALNLAGAALAFQAFASDAPAAGQTTARPWFAPFRDHLADPRLRRAFAIGFCILFAFIGTFTYVNFVLVGPAIGLAPMALGFVYFVFLPSIVTTPVAGRLVADLGTIPTLIAGLAIAGCGLPLLLVPKLAVLLFGLVQVGVGTFLAQAVATGYVARTAVRDRAAASGLYLASYFSGGLVGSVALGWLYDAAGWTAVVPGIAAALAVASALALRLERSDPVRGT